jgi:hypothetical protein
MRFLKNSEKKKKKKKKLGLTENQISTNFYANFEFDPVFFSFFLFFSECPPQPMLLCLLEL